MSVKRNTLWNLFGSAGPMLIGIATIPYVYHQIGIERIGVLTLIWALIGYFSIFDFGLGRAITQRIASITSLQIKTQKITTATTGVFLTLTIGIIASFVGFIIVELVGFSWFESTKDLEQEIYSSFLLACLAIPATTTTAGLRGILEGEQHFKAINILKLVLGFSNFLGPIVAIAMFGPHLEYIVGALVLTRYILLAAHCSISSGFIGRTRDYLSLKESKSLFQFGGWMTLSNIVSPLMVVADRFLIGKVLGPATVAYYTIPTDFLFRLLIIPVALSTTLFPIFSKRNEEDDIAAKYYKKGFVSILATMSSISLFIIVFGKQLLYYWLGEDFANNSYLVAVIISFGIVFTSLAQVPFAYIQATGDARITAVFHVLEVIIYIPVLLYLIKMYGVEGVALAWTIRAGLDFTLLHSRAIQIRANIRKGLIKCK